MKMMNFVQKLRSRFLVAFAALVLALCVFFAAFVAERTNEMLMEGDRSFEEMQMAPPEWRTLSRVPWHYARSQMVSDEQWKLREAFRKKDVAAIEQLTASNDTRVASFASNTFGVVVIQEAIKKQNPELVALALSLFTRAAETDGANEDAKFNLELLLNLITQDPSLLGGGNADDTEGTPQPGDDPGGDKGGRGPLGGGY